MQRLFPVLISLACTAEPVARQLFQPLLMSLVHWLTRSARRRVAAAFDVWRHVLMCCTTSAAVLFQPCCFLFGRVQGKLLADVDAVVLLLACPQ